MLKNILKIEGVQEMNKTEQKSLQGGGGSGPCSGGCYQKQGMCCIASTNFCDAGNCTSRGCVFY